MSSPRGSQETTSCHTARTWSSPQICCSSQDTSTEEDTYTTTSLSWLRCPATSSRSHTMPCISCVMSQFKKLGHFSRVCHSKPIQPHPQWPYTSTLQSTQHGSSLSEQAGLSNIHHVTSTVPAPKLKIDITTLNGATTTAVLPDSGADISAASTSILSQLNEHIDNLLPSSVIPKSANGAEIHPVGRLPVCFKIGNKKHLDDLHITLMLQAHWCPGRHVRNLESYQTTIPTQPFPALL